MRNFTEQEKSIILENYIKNKKGLLYTAKLVNSTPNTIKRFLKNQGIYIRNKAEAIVTSNKNKELYKDSKYFSNQSPNMAWLLGFIASDGTVRKSKNEIKIGLAIKDKEILDKIKQELKLQVEVKTYTANNGYDCCSLTWTCEQHKKDLSKYSIIPNKTFVLKPPYKLEKKFWIDYIRGYFDGDGSVNNINNRALRWQICSASKEILQWMINFFYEEYNIPKVRIYEKVNPSGNKLYYFQYSTNSAKQIYSILYNTNSTLCLKRKKDKFEEILSLI